MNLSFRIVRHVPGCTSCLWFVLKSHDSCNFSINGDDRRRPYHVFSNMMMRCLILSSKVLLTVWKLAQCVWIIHVLFQWISATFGSPMTKGLLVEDSHESVVYSISHGMSLLMIFLCVRFLFGICFGTCCWLLTPNDLYEHKQHTLLSSL